MVHADSERSASTEKSTYELERKLGVTVMDAITKALKHYDRNPQGTPLYGPVAEIGAAVIAALRTSDDFSIELKRSDSE